MSIGNGYTLYLREDAQILGSGKFGAVSLGTIMCDNANAEERNVAVKMLKGDLKRKFLLMQMDSTFE